MYYYRMCTAGMTHVEANSPADISDHLHPFAILGLKRVNKIVAMESADVPEALDTDLLASDGTLEQ